MSHASGVLLLVMLTSLTGSASATAATYRAASADDLRAVLPRLRPGDVVEMGSAYMGDMFLRKGNIGMLRGVILKGGVFRTVRLDDALDVTLEGGRVVMPVTANTKPFDSAMLFYGPTNLVIRNYEVLTDQNSGFRKGYGISIDQRGGGAGVVIENTHIHDILSGFRGNTLNDVTLRRVTTDMISGDSFYIGHSSKINFDNLSCGQYDGVNYNAVHPDCIQIDEVSGPTTDLRISNLIINQTGGDPTQWIFAGTPRNNFRHARWTITGTRGYGMTYRAISVSGVDGLTISDNVLRTPPNSKYFTMLAISHSTDVIMSDNVACYHERKEIKNLQEKRRKTISCR